MMLKNRLARFFVRIPTIETERLILRRILPKDCENMYDYSKREEVTRYLLWIPHESREYTRRYIDALQTQYRSGQFYDWALELKENGRMIGTCGFAAIDEKNNSAEVGYVLAPDYWGFGYAPEALREILRVGFETLGFNRIEARYMTGNEKSRRVMEKCGMKFEGIRREALYVKDSYRSIGYCSMLKDEFFSLYGRHEVKNEPKPHWYDAFVGGVNKK